MYIIKIQTLMIVSHMTVLIQQKKPVSYNLTKIIIAFVTDPEKVELRLNELRIWLKNHKYPDHIISNAFYNAKLQGPAPKSKNLLRLLSNSSIFRNLNLPKGIFKCNEMFRV